MNSIEHCHKPITTSEDNDAMRWLCTECKESGVIRKDHRGVLFNRQYAKVFNREILQPNTNLFYKYYPQHLRT